MDMQFSMHPSKALD